ncbi:hypothetical protein Dtox_3553 [Desulfofarcimen acetoxidans DSM 771]|uniref:Uncharacterized protein n=1 Tax=Desulfofarcimen acetoxidans (strain ATCC 49208 / DSM 771 / KCTC 5769 / VKM B-1644 / 5575) TaxID=485916 RepID=C8VVX8_DESAS|nr:hypothetical protein Dtox_3553 [Desulfofarcimen acetoxidans DSM 771]
MVLWNAFTDNAKIFQSNYLNVLPRIWNLELSIINRINPGRKKDKKTVKHESVGLRMGFGVD